mmetsp:Transcript_51559/g.99668  ORF Transcript_51559/g.99668 Transcript_51559/m.99668 type:complete len:190 (-) Transcript_51559:100-669(-)
MQVALDLLQSLLFRCCSRFSPLELQQRSEFNIFSSFGTSGCDSRLLTLDTLDTSHAEKLNFLATKTVCASWGGALAQVHSEEDSRHLQSRVPGPVWIGLDELELERRWLWTDGISPRFSAWQTGEPDNFKTDEDCAAFGSAGARDVHILCPSFVARRLGAVIEVSFVRWLKSNLLARSLHQTTPLFLFF